MKIKIVSDKLTFGTNVKNNVVVLHNHIEAATTAYIASCFVVRANIVTHITPITDVATTL